MRIATITPEEIDVDYTYLEFDRHVTRTTWVVNFYASEEDFAAGKYEDECCYKTEEFAKDAKAKYEAEELVNA
jgi:hypothetical protein